MAQELDGYRDFASSRLDGLRRTAYLLCGDWHTADDRRPPWTSSC